MEASHKAFYKKVFEEIHINSNGFDFETEVTVNMTKKGY